MDGEYRDKENKTSDPFWDLSFARPSSADRFIGVFSSDTDAPLVSVGEDVTNKDDARSYIIPNRPTNIYDRSEAKALSEEEKYRVDIDFSEGRERTAEDEEFASYFASVRARANRSAQTGGRFTEDLVKRADERYTVSVPHSVLQKKSGIMGKYEPKHPLITRVELLEWPSKYTFYDKFRRDAIRYFNSSYAECEYEDFTSLVPQYSMMTEGQRRYYFWWRACVREGRYIKASKSYVLLLIYEVINLPDLVLPKDGVRIMCELIKNYRSDILGIRKFVSAWLRDYCLIHRVGIPSEYVGIAATFAGNHDMLPEFFVRFDEDQKVDPLSLVELISYYSWQNSRYIKDENREIFERYMPMAILAACKTYGEELPFGIEKLSEGKYISESYSGAVCASETKCRIRVTYRRCSHADEYSYATWTVKYAENQVRRLLGIKARFKVGELPAQITEAIDGCFAPVFEQMRQRQRQEKDRIRDEQTMPIDYERYYESEREEISFERALEIERSSWEVTRRLVDAFDADPVLQIDDTENIHAPMCIETKSEADENAIKNSSDDGILRRAVKFLLDGNISGFTALAKEQKMFPDTLAERVNNEFFDLIGDVVIDQSDPSYPIIEDYRAEVEEYARG